MPLHSGKLSHVGVDDVIEGDGDRHKESQVVARLHCENVAVITCVRSTESLSKEDACL